VLSGGKFDEGVTSCFSFTLSRVHNIKEKLLDAIILGMFWMMSIFLLQLLFVGYKNYLMLFVIGVTSVL